MEFDAHWVNCASCDVSHEEEKGKVQGANDTIAYFLAAISSFFGGYLQIKLGWNVVMIAIVAQIIIVPVAVCGCGQSMLERLRLGEHAD